ncbi:MAG: response regulator [Actinobacteria bacterium]|nr:response regulator [Actinomycetota bacterium]
MARVLVVEDDHVIRELLVVNLKMEGHEAITAADGSEALAAVDAHAPDVVLLDMMLPGVDGWEVTSRLKGDDATRRIPIVALSARAMQADVERGMALGVDHYVTKPFDPIELMQLVTTLLEQGESR